MINVPIIQKRRLSATGRKYRRCVLGGIAFLFVTTVFYLPTYYTFSFDEGSMTKKGIYRPGYNISILNDSMSAPATLRPTYLGEVQLEGWSVNTSRDLHIYIRPGINTTRISPYKILQKENQLTEPKKADRLFLLIAVTSAVQNFEVRTAIRETWGSVEISGVRLVFVLGYLPSDELLQEKVLKESQHYGDIIQEDFVDSYTNLTLKSVMLLKWINVTGGEHYTPNFVMKTDDDMFVNVPKLVELLAKRRSQKTTLLGKLICNAVPISDSVNKWYSPKYMFRNQKYPPYLSGTGYIIAGALVNPLYRVALELPLFHLEDIFITGICARRLFLRPENHPEFFLKKYPINICSHHRVITSHHFGPQELYQVWKRVTAKKKQCFLPASREKRLRAREPRFCPL